MTSRVTPLLEIYYTAKDDMHKGLGITVTSQASVT